MMTHRNSIQNKILVSLVAVALLATVATSAAGIYAARQLFSEYLIKKAASQAEIWAAAFSSYYVENGSFDGVETVFSTAGRGRGPGRIWGKKGNGVILVGLDNRIIYDSTYNLTGKLLDPDQTAGGTPVYADSRKVGTIIVPASGLQNLNTLEAAFIDSFALYSITIGLIAALAALLLGILMFRPISGPLGKISEAIHRLAQGELDVQVPVLGEGEFRQLGEEFNTMAESLRRNDTMRRNLTADVAHELRTPLAVLRANLESMQTGTIQPDSSTIASLQDEVIRMGRLIKDIEILALAETGNLVLDLRSTDFREVIERLAPVAMDIETRKMEIEFLIQEELPSVNIDIDRTVQVMLNLLSNAIAHSPTGGKITVKAEKQGSMVRVSVSDQGRGISPEQLPYVFERFYRADSARSRSEGGMGLGLAIAKSYVTAQGGTIRAESTPGQGSIFEFTIPVSE